MQRQNLSELLRGHAARRPKHAAIITATGRDRGGGVRYETVSYAEIDRRVDALAAGFVAAGLAAGDNCLVMLRPGLDFVATIFALGRMGAVPVLVDPGMGLSRMLHCFEQTQARGFVGIPLAHVVRVVFRRSFASVEVAITAGRRWLWGGVTLAQCERDTEQPFTAAKTHDDQPAAIVFTTGSTGPAKGAVLTHGVFGALCDALRERLGVTADEVNLATFPGLAFIDLMHGITSVFPLMDFGKPAEVIPSHIIDAIERHGVTSMFASPALLERLGRAEERPSLPTLQRVMSAGAPVSEAIVEGFLPRLSPDASFLIPYGATEAAMITCIDARERRTETREQTERGLGVCVGRPLRRVEVRIVAISDEPIAQWAEELELERGGIGEVVIRGPHVSPRYHRRPEQDALHKIADDSGAWHRTGDLGRLDEDGRLWLLGRKTQRVITERGTLFTLACEPIFAAHPSVHRAALVGLGERPQQRPVMCIELTPDATKVGPSTLRDALVAVARSHDLTMQIETFLFHDGFPVDSRHNAKIRREKLAAWAAKQSAVAKIQRRQGEP